ncbi:hypothetical protein BC332_02539 [Capsicum chinense]|nr:hypothetical protein BC332_02539 [Capsicum chinense]
MDIETVFLSCFKIQENPSDLFSLIEAALQVGVSKYPVSFQKRKTRIINFLMDPSTLDDDSVVGDKDEVIGDSVGGDEHNGEESDKQNQSSIVGFKKTSETDLVVTQLNGAEDKQVTPQSHTTTRKRMSLNVSTKRVQVAPLMAKETERVSDMKKFESSKRKYEERLAEQSEAKRRIVMVDFHHMPKPAKDPRAPKRCWDTRRF